MLHSLIASLGNCWYCSVLNAKHHNLDWHERTMVWWNGSVSTAQCSEFLCQGHSSLDDRGTDVGGKFGPFFPGSRSYIQEIVLLLISSQKLLAKQRWRNTHFQESRRVHQIHYTHFQGNLQNTTMTWLTGATTLFCSMGKNAGLFKYPHLLSMLMFKHFDLLPRSQSVSPQCRTDKSVE